MDGGGISEVELLFDYRNANLRLKQGTGHESQDEFFFFLKGEGISSRRVGQDETG